VATKKESLGEKIKSNRGPGPFHDWAKEETRDL